MHELVASRGQIPHSDPLVVGRGHELRAVGAGDGEARHGPVVGLRVEVELQI